MVEPRTLKLLVIDDEPQNLELIRHALNSGGIEIFTADSPKDGLELFKRSKPQVVLLDLMMPDVHGFEVLEEILAIDPAAEVILITAHYSTETAVEAIQKGACDYFDKPLNIQKLQRRVSDLMSEAELRQKTHSLEHALIGAFQFEGVVGRSPVMLDVFAKLRRIAPHYRSVLITGATGSGKEMVARVLHQISPSANGPFAVCNCSAIVETLVESELFGYVRGAFTGATQDKIGVFEYGNHGTVFLDEIGELPLAAQGKLLRVLQNHQTQRIGSPVLKEIDVRVIAATNRNLRAMIRDGKFREDLYYRLAMVEVSLPSLRERREDLYFLERHFLKKFAAEYKKPIAGLTRRAQQRLSSYSWPGNVRQLENVIGNACMMVDGTIIDVRDLPEPLRGLSTNPLVEEEQMISLQEVQERHVRRVLEFVGGNKSQAAEILGMSRASIYNFLAQAKDNRTSSPGSVSGSSSPS